MAYLSAVYAGRDDHNTLSKLTGQSYPDLDKQYRQFLERQFKSQRLGKGG